MVQCCASISSAAVFFPVDTNFQGHVSGCHSRRISKRADKDLSILRKRRGWILWDDGNGYPEVRTKRRLAFTPYQASLSLSLLAALGYIGRTLQSESVKRAMYFWFHAGPVVFHYKFTRWHLTRTRAPLHKRDQVYNSLHDRYCQRCLDIALHLRGLYVKVRGAYLVSRITLLLLR